MSFGKYKGRTFSYILNHDSKYLGWLHSINHTCYGRHQYAFEKFFKPFEFKLRSIIDIVDNDGWRWRI